MHRSQVVLGLMLAAAFPIFLAGCGPDTFKPKAKTYNPTPAQMEQAASARSPVVGEPAPDFSLKNQNDQTVNLRDLRGQWVVLYFYPKDDTPGCACEATEFTALLTQFHGLNAKIFGVSEDPPEVHRVFIQHYTIDIGLLSDPDHKTMRDYGAWVDTRLGPKTYERMIRSTFIIDPQGVIRYHWPEVIPTGHAQRVHDMLLYLQSGAQTQPSAAAPPGKIK